MNIIVLEDYQAMSEQAAKLVEEQIKLNSHSVLGLSTGSTPLGLYECLINGFKEREISYQHVTTFNLDEYLGLGKNHPNSYHTFINERLFQHIDIEQENTHIPNGMASSIEKECVRYEDLLDNVGPIDLQILGIGTNGHIGFNEPGTSEFSKTHVVKLDETTRQNNARFFDSKEDIPNHAITMGIASILKSKQILLLASGEKKASAVKQLLSKEIDANFPASWLWQHENVTLLVDQDAYKLIGNRNGSEGYSTQKNN
ncbi:MAG: glucosamine-6-phosphate deaminase [Paenisporosarcina sp.]|uniref:glucosamine-6-phosphate deaminase n=1 Tax=Paenisporosarcina sp. TaxID=1932001 RepID=UPI003C72BBAC